MQYNYDFEIASLLIMTIILLHFVFVRQFPGEKTRVFGWLLFVCEAECLMNILSCVGLANAALVPQRLNEVLAFAFFVLEGASSYLVYRYFMAACAIRGRERTVFAAAGIIPFAAFLVLVAVTPVTGFFYYFSDGSYYQGVGADYGYAYIVIFFLLDLLIVVRQHKYTTLRTKVIVCAYTAVAGRHDRVAILAQGDALHQRQQYGRAHNALSADSESGGVSGHDNRNRERDGI